MNKKRFIIPGLLIIVGVAGWFTYSNYTDESRENIEKQTTENWKTYTNTTYRYAIKYPTSGFDVKDIKGIDGRVDIYPTQQPIEFGPVLSIVTLANETDLEKEIDNFIDEDKLVISKDTIVINGIKWVKLVYEDIGGVGPEFIMVNYFTIKNDYIYRMTYNETSRENNDIFEKMIETILFIN